MRNRLLHLTRGRLVALAAVVALLALGTYALFFSSWLAVDEVEVTGTGYLTPEQVLAAADVDLGVPLARVDTGAVEDRVAALPEVGSVELSRSWPGTLGISVVEREPALVLTDGSTFGVYDLEGVEFLTPTAAPPGLPVLRATDAAPDPQVVRSVLAVVGVLPEDLRARVVEIEAPTLDSIALHLTDDILVEFGNAENGARKVQVLTELLAQPASVYNVSAPDAPAIRPLPTD